MNIKLILTLISFFILTSCNQNVEKTKSENSLPIENDKSSFIANEKYLTKHSDSCKCSAEFELEDSIKLEHIKNQFYKSKTGHLYERTSGQREVNGHLTDFEYFNGYFSQDVDPLTFEVLDGWYAKDKNNVYYYRPVSGGMQILKMENIDVKTFKILKGHYKYAKDNNHFYNENEIIENFIPNKTNLYFDKKGKAIKMKTNRKEFIFEQN